MITGSITSKGNVFRFEFTARLEGTRLLSLMIRLPLAREHEVGEKERRVRVRRAARDADGIGPPEGGLERLPADRGTLHGQAFRVVVVDICGERDLARGDQLTHECVPAADLRLRLRQPAEEEKPLFLAHVFHHGAKPVDIASLDADPAGEPRVKKIVVGIRHLVRLHEVGVVADGEEVEAVRDVMPVLRKSGLGQVAEMGAAELVEQLFAVERLHLGAVRLQDVADETAGARLRDGALHDPFAAGAPELRLDAVPLLEGSGEGNGILQVERRVDDDLAFPASASEDAGFPIRPLQKVQGAMRRVRGLRLSARHPRGTQQPQHGAVERPAVRTHGTVCGTRDGRSAPSRAYASSIRGASPCLASASANH